jgi:hypothetical protein
MELRHGSFLYAFIMTDDCIMQTALKSHISFIEFETGLACHSKKVDVVSQNLSLWL